MRAFLTGILVFSGIFPISCAIAAVLDTPRTCSQQRETCIIYRLKNGPAGSAGLCVTAFNACMRSGVWDATALFPYGGVRFRGMIRR
jgi:hypothetical protein